MSMGAGGGVGTGAEVSVKCWRDAGAARRRRLGVEGCEEPFRGVGMVTRLVDDDDGEEEDGRPRLFGAAIMHG